MKETKIVETFLLRLEKDLKVKVIEKAKKENRSLNGHIVTVLQKDVKEK